MYYYTKMYYYIFIITIIFGFYKQSIYKLLSPDKTCQHRSGSVLTHIL